MNEKCVYVQENDEQASSPSGSETPGPQRPRSNSGRELTDEVLYHAVVHTYLSVTSFNKMCVWFFFSFCISLSMQEILASVMIKNLDTGEEIPLIQAEEKLPTGINPLTLHIMRRTKEYIT